ncbi:MAG: hypothetical protein ACR2HH_09880 [Chthoniobacterales bacterium]
MKRTPSKILTIALLALAVAATNLRADERLQNGGFETGSFPPWTFTDNNPPPPFINVGGDSAFAHSGTYHANLGSSPMTGTLSQTFQTVAGAMYTISFYLANDGTPNPAMGSFNSFMTTFNGLAIAGISALTNSAPFGYTLFTGTATATGASSTLQFTFQNDADFFRLDDVSVNGPAPAGVPDQGSTFWLALPAVGALVLSQRLGRKTRSVTA